MNVITQALSISNEHKEISTLIYMEVVKEVINKNYSSMYDDALTELSALFRVKWINKQSRNSEFLYDANLYAEANNAFNYSNCMYRHRNRFIKLAKALVVDEERIDDQYLNKLASQMKFLLANTTPENVESQLRLEHSWINWAKFARMIEVDSI